MSRATLSKTSYTTAFTPTSIAGCQLWLDGADSTTLTGTSPVTQWTDKSGNARTMTSVVGSGVLTYANNGIYCSNAYMYVTSPVNLINFSLFIVAKASPSSANCSLFAGRPDTSPSYSSTDGFGFYLDTTYTARVFCNGNGLTNTATYTNQNLYSYTVTSAGSISSWVNGNVGNSQGISARTTTAQGFALGAEWSGTNYGFAGIGGVPTSGYVYEVIIYNTALTTAQRQSVEGHLAWKWGLQASLPTFSEPTSITGCALWLDASDASSFTFSSGSIISVWRDKSASANHLNLVSVTTPSRTTDGGRSVVNFPMGAVLSTTNQISFTQSSAFFVVAKLLSMNSGYLLGFTNTSGASAAGDFAIRFDQGVLIGVAGGGDENDLGLSQYYTNGTFNTSFTSATYYNTYFIVDTTQPSTSSTTYLTLSSLIYSASRALNGNIAEVLYYPAGVTSTQRQQIEGYLAWKWGTQAALPASHPYSGGSPTHAYTAAAPTGASSRPAISAALVPAGAKAMSKASYYTTFTPTSIAGCQIWLDGADPAGTGVAPANGSTVSTWVDKSGNGYNGTATNTSTYSSGGILFNSSYYSTTYTANPTAETAFVVCKTTSRVTSDLIVCTPNGCREFYIDNSDAILLNSKGAFVIASAGLFPISNAVQLLEYTYSTSVATLYKYGASVSSVSGSYAFTGSSVTYIGGNDRGFMTGYIYEIIIYNSVLTTAQRQQVEGYLAWKWGVQAQLPQSLAPALTNPTTISGCILWLDATDPVGTGTPPANGTTLTTWKDKSVSNFPFTSAGSAYNTTAVNSLPGINISTNFFGYDPGSSQNNWQEIFVVGLWTGGSTFNDYNGLVTGSIDIGTDGIVFIGNSGSTSWYGSGNGYQTPFLNGTQTGVALPAISTPFIIRTVTGSAVSIRGLRFGLDRIHTGRKWVGFISEVICYNTALTGTQRQQVEGYLAWKWGTQSQLPANHPNYSSSPFHSYAAAAPIGANLRPAISQALVPAGVRGLAATAKITNIVRTFIYTGTDQTFVVPAGVTTLTLYMWAAGGQGTTTSNGSFYGGAGAYVQGVLTVTPGETLTIYVGQRGPSGYAYAYKNGGFNDTTDQGCGGGGGRSGIARGSTNIIAVGAGGGGGGSGNGGAGGITTGSAGGGTNPGGGGTQTGGGGAGHSSYNDGGDGQNFGGGNGPGAYGGSGGDGYYGGGGGAAYGADQLGGGGGGGSSLTSNLTSLVTYVSSNGYSAPNTSSPYYVSGVAAGGYGLSGSGGDGRVVVIYSA